MIKEVTGIIVSTTNYSESSKILNIFTKDGIIGVISKGCRNLKNKNRNVSDNFIYGKFNIYYRENKLSTLMECEVIDYFKNIRTDIVLISYLTYITELCTKVYNQNETYEIYELLINSILKINDGFNPKVITNILEVKLLDYLGVSLQIDECVKCGSKNIITVSPYLGGYVCKNCMKNDKILNPKSIKMLRLYYYVDIEKISELKIKDEIIEEINSFLNEYYDHFTGLYIKSKKFLKNINKINL